MTPPFHGDGGVLLRLRRREGCHVRLIFVEIPTVVRVDVRTNSSPMKRELVVLVVYKTYI